MPQPLGCENGPNRDPTSNNHHPDFKGKIGIRWGSRLALTEAILGASSLDEAQKDELIEQVAFLSEQAVAGAKDRKPGVIKATLGAVSQAAGSISAVAGAWQAAEPILKNLFGLWGVSPIIPPADFP